MFCAGRILSPLVISGPCFLSFENVAMQPNCARLFSWFNYESPALPLNYGPLIGRYSIRVAVRRAKGWRSKSSRKERAGKSPPGGPLAETALRRGTHFFKARAGYGGSVLFPVIPIEKLQGKHSAKTNLPKRTKNGLKRCDALSRINALRIADRRAGRLRRVIIAVHHVHSRAAQES